MGIEGCLPVFREGVYVSQPGRGGNIIAPLGLVLLICMKATNMTAPLGLAFVHIGLIFAATTSLQQVPAPEGR